MAAAANLCAAAVGVETDGSIVCPAGNITEIVRRLEKRAACTGYQIILADSEENVVSERARIGALISRKIDGLIVIPCHDNSPVLEDLRKSEIPTVLSDNDSKHKCARLVTLSLQTGGRLFVGAA